MVDDEPGFRNLLQWELEYRGMRVQTASNGVEALAKAATNAFDAIITDITMPEMDGLRFLENIKRRAPQTPVIIATGFGAIETAVYAIKEGAFDFVLKPYDLEYLISQVRQAVARVNERRAPGRTGHGQ
ncbi:MAG TPA: response regulator [Elusimicrobiota bacterium]|nr:response regulator [Elusimicrobiota bacterium]